MWVLYHMNLLHNNYTLYHNIKNKVTFDINVFGPLIIYFIFSQILCVLTIILHQNYLLYYIKITNQTLSSLYFFIFLIAICNKLLLNSKYEKLNI